MFFTVYKITNEIDGKIYIGSHKTADLDDGYMGSGKYLKRAIEKHGEENFHKDILFVYDNPKEMFSKERELVNEKYLSEGNTYNLKLGGDGGFDHLNKDGANNPTHTKDHMKMMEMRRLKKYSSEEWAKLTGRKNGFVVARMELEKRKHNGTYKNGFAEKSHSDKTKKIMSSKHKGKVPWNKGKTKHTDERLMKLSVTNSKKLEG